MTHRESTWPWWKDKWPLRSMSRSLPIRFQLNWPKKERSIQGRGLLIWVTEVVFTNVLALMSVLKSRMKLPQRRSRTCCLLLSLWCPLGPTRQSGWRSIARIRTSCQMRSPRKPQRTSVMMRRTLKQRTKRKVCRRKSCICPRLTRRSSWTITSLMSGKICTRTWSESSLNRLSKSRTMWSVSRSWWIMMRNSTVSFLAILCHQDTMLELSWLTQIGLMNTKWIVRRESILMSTLPMRWKMLWVTSVPFSSALQEAIKRTTDRFKTKRAVHSTCRHQQRKTRSPTCPIAHLSQRDHPSKLSINREALRIYSLWKKARSEDIMSELIQARRRQMHSIKKLSSQVTV